jgi:hypothetical protein
MAVVCPRVCGNTTGVSSSLAVMKEETGIPPFVMAYAVILAFLLIGALLG